MVEAQDRVEIDDGQHHEQSEMSISEDEGNFEDDGNVDFGTQIDASIVADAVAELSLHDDIDLLEEDIYFDDVSSKSSEDTTQQ